MHHVWIIAFHKSHRSRWFYGHHAMTRALFLYSAVAAERKPADVRVLSDNREVLELAGTLGMEPHTVINNAAFPEILSAAGVTGLVMAPHRGAISPTRVRRILDASAAHPDATTISAPAVPANCHPAWLRLLTADKINGYTATVSDFTCRQPAISAEERKALGISAKGVSGSQWLPELHVPDFAVCFVPRSNAPIIYIDDDTLDYSDLPLLYRLPVFQLHKDQTPDFDLAKTSPEILLSTSENNFSV